MTDAAKHPSRKDIRKAVRDPERLKAVHETKIYKTKPEAVFDALTKRASELLNAPLVLITLVDEHSDYVKSQVGLEKRYADKQEIPYGPSFCQLTVAQKEPVIIRDVSKFPTLRLFPSVAFRHVRAHLGVPLVLDGHAIGNCCVIDYQPHDWTEADVANLQAIADEAMAEIRLRQEDAE
jgi:GAF domain-containing protein